MIWKQLVREGQFGVLLALLVHTSLSLKLVISRSQGITRKILPRSLKKVLAHKNFVNLRSGMVGSAAQKNSPPVVMYAGGTAGLPR